MAIKHMFTATLIHKKPSITLLKSQDLDMEGVKESKQTPSKCIRLYGVMIMRF